MEDRKPNVNVMFKTKVNTLPSEVKKSNWIYEF